jgi:hypothetical protein
LSIPIRFLRSQLTAEKEPGGSASISEFYCHLSSSLSRRDSEFRSIGDEWPRVRRGYKWLSSTMDVSLSGHFPFENRHRLGRVFAFQEGIGIRKVSCSCKGVQRMSMTWPFRASTFFGVLLTETENCARITHQNGIVVF